MLRRGNSIKGFLSETGALVLRQPEGQDSDSL